MSSLFRALSAVGCASVLAVTACQTVPINPSPDFVPDMVVNTDYAQFFRLGPQQAGGADLSLRTNEQVMLLRKEFGYSSRTTKSVTLPTRISSPHPSLLPKRRRSIPPPEKSVAVPQRSRNTKMISTIIHRYPTRISTSRRRTCRSNLFPTCCPNQSRRPQRLRLHSRLLSRRHYRRHCLPQRERRQSRPPPDLPEGHSSARIFLISCSSSSSIPAHFTR
jgi:hypothetical protein